MQRFTPWLVLALVLVVPIQPVQARNLSAAVADTQRAVNTGIIPPHEQDADPSESITRTIFAQGANEVTVTMPISSTDAVTATPTVQPTLPPSTPAGPTPTAVDLPTPTATSIPTSAPDPAGPIEGTIIANRTESLVRFFLEGQTYDLAPLRAQGTTLQRDATVLNLFNCDANTPQTQEGCFWDPYLLNRDGFYEIVSGQEAGKAVNLILREAGTPPLNQIWVQNRTGNVEVLFYNDEEFELAPSSVQEFTGQQGVPMTLYVRSCLDVADKTVCEWRPQSVETGIYYALNQLDTAGAVPGSQMHLVQLEALVGSSQSGPVVDTPPQIVCNLLVPALNVRTGPGLEYEISTKVRGTETEPGSVLVTGRDASGQWLAVDERVAAGGWIISSPNFVSCSGDISALPEAEVTDGRLATQPATVDAQSGDNTTAPASADGEPQPPAEAITATAPLTTTIPDGQALLIVNNAFDQPVRFTLDQSFRVEEGPSEFDLEPGQSISIFVFPGQVGFSASSAWRGLAGNDDFFIDNKESRTLWLTFTPDPGGSGRWDLQY